MQFPVQHPPRSAFRRLALLALLPAALTACMPPDKAETQQDAPAVASTAGTDAMAHDHAGAEEPAAAGEHAEHAEHDHGGETPAVTESTGELPLEVEDAAVTAVPASLSDTVAYVTLKNPSDADVVLVAAASPAAEHAMLMNTVTSDSGSSSMSGMVQADTLTVPAGGELTLESAGDHIMLMGLKEPLEEGQTVEITLQADDGRTTNLTATVKKP